MRDIWKLYDSIVGGERFVTTLPEGIVDDLSNTTRGYSFLSNEPFHSARHAVFFRLVTRHRLCTVDSLGRIAWNVPAVHNLLARAAKLWRLLSYLLAMTSQISIRLRQFMELTFVNADRMRSIIWQSGEALIMLNYSKMSQITDQDRYSPAFIHRDVSLILLEALGGGLREAEALFVHVISGSEAAQVHRT